MPTAGTHITIIERLALDARFAPLLGDPYADVSEPEGKQMRYAKLGAIGPDLFYALMDYGPELQDLTNFLCKLAGSFECIGEVTKDIDDFVAKVKSDVTFGVSDEAKKLVGEFEGIFGLISSTISEGLMAILIDRGLNFFPVFEARRQQDQPRTTWFWADYLHYVRTGEFVNELFKQSKGNINLRAYAFGYLSHYVTDVVGHPFVNQVVGAPWRLYWQRHHLVENFIDAYVWDKWHDAQPAPQPPSSEEQPLDLVRKTPHNDSGEGAPFTFARLNDHIKIGYPQGADPIDELIHSICDKIHQGLEDIGVAEPEPIAPNDADFIEWTQMLANVFRETYPAGEQPPTNLADDTGRDGYPLPDDIASAYTVLRLFLRFSTEQGISEPEFPDIMADVWNAMKKVLDDVANNLSAIAPPPHIGNPGGAGFSFEVLWSELQAWAKWAVETQIAIGTAAFGFIKDAIAVAGVALLDSIKIGLYFIKKALFEIYRAFRHILVRAGYAIPFTDELNSDLGAGIKGASLWTTPSKDGDAGFPLEELPDLEREKIQSQYPPWVPPVLLPEMLPPNKQLFEEPMTWVAPYGQNATPDAFIDAAIGTRVMLSATGPLDFNVLPTPGPPFHPPADFGGAIANCEQAFEMVLFAQQHNKLPLFPDYNLDGDRGYAWPCWDVRNPGVDHLDPKGHGHITVDPVLIT